MRFGHELTIRSNNHFEMQFRDKAYHLLKQKLRERRPAHAAEDLDETKQVRELLHVTEHFGVGTNPEDWQKAAKPNLPWAEDHFLERISGEPLNPPPSEQYWPFAQAGNAMHKVETKFSHTYPERFWPKHAEQECNVKGRCTIDDHVRGRKGIRFIYGDFNDLVQLLRDDPHTRQAYLPIWFPEDLSAARAGQRVPCSMGYHFIYDFMAGALDCVYTMRSCDLLRFYRDDVYMAGRLLQVVADEAKQIPGSLVVHIDNLHTFGGDDAYLKSLLGEGPEVKVDIRSSYNLDALS